MVVIAARTREFSGIPTENSAPAFATACRIDEEQYAESARTRMSPAPHRRAVVIASRIIRTAPWDEGPRAAQPGRGDHRRGVRVLTMASWALSPRIFV